MVHIQRLSAYADKLRAYTILLDDSDVGEIRDGETKSIEAAPGQHTLKLQISWCSSNEVSFVIKNKGEHINFRCVSSLKGSSLWLAVVYAFFMPKRYIRLEFVTPRAG